MFYCLVWMFCGFAPLICEGCACRLELLDLWTVVLLKVGCLRVIVVLF